jgi:hypothetical protein
MTSTVLLIFVATWIACMIRYPARGETAALPVHPSEGYLFGDPASPTQAERERERMREEAMA